MIVVAVAPLELSSASLSLSDVHSNLQVDTTTYHLREVTVAEQAAAARSAVSATTPTQRIGAHEIESLGLSAVADAVKQLSGVAVRDYGGLGGMKTVSVRNLGAAHTAVSYDGVPVSNCMAGQIDLSRFGSERLEEVRLHIGLSDDWLSPAIYLGYSGLLSMTTSSVLPTHCNFTADCSYANWNTYNASAALDVPLTTDVGSVLRQSLSLSGAVRGTDGDYPFTLNNGTLSTREHRQNSRVHGGQAEAEWRLRRGETAEGAALQWDTKAYYYKTHNELPGGVIYYNTLSREELREENILLQSRLRARWGGRWQAQAIVKYNHARTVHTDSLQPDSQQRDVYNQDEVYLQSAVSYRPARRWTVALSEDVQWATLHSTLPDCPNPLRTSSYTALRAGYRSERLTVQGAWLATVVRDPDATNYNYSTPALSASVKLVAGFPLYLRLSARGAYRLPSFNDLYYYRIGNRDLRPERATEYNAGLAFRQGGWSVTADYYEQDVHDKIVAFPATFAWKMANFERARLHGVDVSASYAVVFARDVNCRFNAGYMYQRAEDRTELTRGSQLPYTPRHSGNGSALFSWHATSLGYTVQWMGERYSSRMNTWRYRLSPYADQSLTVSHTFAGRWTLYATVQNLVDSQYEVVQYYPMPGRQWRIGFRLR